MTTQMVRSVLAAGLSLALAPTAVASADSIRISGPKQVAAGSAASFAITGDTSKKRLVVWADVKSCAKTSNAEARRSQSLNVILRQVHGHFRTGVHVGHSVAGPHYLCAYLYRAPGGNNPHDPRARLRYVTA